METPHKLRTGEAHGVLASPPADISFTQPTVNAVKTASWASSPAVRRVMQGNRSRDTRPELAVRSATHRRGLRFRVCARPVKELACSADIVFRKAKVAVFIDGCFWHGCPAHHKLPKTNSQYWGEKIEGNIAHDRRNTEALIGLGWRVLRFWAHEETEAIADRIMRTVRSRA